MNLLRKIIGFPFAVLWDLVTSVRNLLFDEDVFSEQSFDLPVISVGNLAVGGTGKTPHVEYFLRLLTKHNEQPAVLSRGYKRETQGYVFVQVDSAVKKVGDEPLQFKIKYPHTGVAVCENRVMGIPQLLMDAPETSIVLLDDAFQHRWVKPGLNILLTDYNNRYTNDLLLPAGNLRESRRGANRADIIIVSKCPQNLSEHEAAHIQNELSAARHQSVYFSTLSYGRPYSFLNRGEFLQSTNYEVVIANGIAKPEYLKKYVKKNYKAAYALNFGDHHSFSERDIYDIEKLYKNVGDTEKVIFITEKDAVKFRAFTDLLKALQLPVYVQPIEVNILFQREKKIKEQIVQFTENFYKK